jgi:flagellar basal body L-ring protein FlgH
MYRDLDKDQAKRNPQQVDQFQRFRNPTPQNAYHNQMNRPPGQNGYSQRVSNQPPQVRRNYRPQNSVKKRYTAADLTDNSQNDSSLWAGKGRQKHLFTAQKDKKHGDIILINVKKDLKNDVTLELKKAFPDFPKAVAKTDETEEKKTEPAEEAAKPQEDETKVYDRVSSVVIEEINDDHLLIRGQKSVLFKKRKRLVEIQALVSRRDITDLDTIDSDSMLETSVHILR